MLRGCAGIVFDPIWLTDECVKPAAPRTLVLQEPIAQDDFHKCRMHMHQRHIWWSCLCS